MINPPITPYSYADRIFSERELEPVPMRFHPYDGEPTELLSLTLGDDAEPLAGATFRFMQPVIPEEGQLSDYERYGRAVNHVDFVEIVPPLDEETARKLAANNKGEILFARNSNKGATIVARLVDAGHVNAHPINRMTSKNETIVTNIQNSVLTRLSNLAVKAARQ